MSEEVVVMMKLKREEAEAFLKLFPLAKIKELQKPQDRLEAKAATLADVLAFCKDRNSPVDGSRFFSYYDGRGWVDGRGEKITDWKSKLIEWEGNGKNNRRKPFQTAAEYEASGGALAGRDIKKLVDDLERI